MSSFLEGLTVEVNASISWLDVSGWLPGEDLRFVGGYVVVPDNLAPAVTIVGPLGLMTRYVLLPQNSKSCAFDGRTGILFPESLLMVPQPTPSRHFDMFVCTVVGCMIISHDLD